MNDQGGKKKRRKTQKDVANNSVGLGPRCQLSG